MTSSTLDARLALSLANTLLSGRYGVPLQRGPRIHLQGHRDSPDPTDLSGVRKWVRSAPKPTAVDLFCGAGGLTQGLIHAGFTVLVGADSDPLAVETYAANHVGLSYLGDLTDASGILEQLGAWGVDSVDVVAGGVPCQPFSRAGRSKIRSLVAARARPLDDSRANLWQSFTRVVAVLRPKIVLLENVPDLAEWDEGGVLIGFCESLRSMGYDTDARILQAFEHGVPQHRSRLFIVGVNPRLRFSWPQPSSKRQPTLWDAISDLPEVPGGQREERLPYDGAKTSLQRSLRRFLPLGERRWINDHITRSVRLDDLEAFQLLPEGGTYDQLPASLQRYRTDIFTDKYKRLVREGLSRTITAHIAKDGYSYIHPTQHRTLSVREAARVQTFPDGFRFAGEPSHRYRQIGNAVPPLLAQAIGHALRLSLQAKPRPQRGSAFDFRSDLLAWHRANARPHPWRVGHTPWHVLMAEMCLHRTRADQVGNIFGSLVQIAPTPRSMVEHGSEVRSLLGPLGVRWRVENMLKVASILMELHDEVVPDTREGLLRLPGVGDYVASAVLCFGFGRTAILMDTNTERIASRTTGNNRSKRRWQLRLDLYRLAGSQGADAKFNFAMLDLGGLVCRAAEPRCLSCPVSHRCASVQPKAAQG